MDAVIIPILQLNKLRRQRAGVTGQRSLSCKWQSPDLNMGYPVFVTSICTGSRIHHDFHSCLWQQSTVPAPQGHFPYFMWEFSTAQKHKMALVPFSSAPEKTYEEKLWRSRGQPRKRESSNKLEAQKKTMHTTY